jgi:hypothetical protein
VKTATTPPDPANPTVPLTTDPRIPTQSENDALVGTSGTPSALNPFVTDDDSRLNRVSIFDANAAPYLATPNDPTITDNGARIAACIAAACTWAQANNGSVSVQLDPGKYWINDAVSTANSARAQIPLPKLTMGTNKVYLLLESKTNSASPQPFQTPGTGASVMLYSTLTGQTYSAAAGGGTPCILGGPDPVNGTSHTDWTWMSFHIRNIAIRAPQNPTVAGLNLSNVNHAVVENFRADVDGVSGLPADFGEPTHPHAVAVLMPLNNTDGMDYRGSCMVAGWYGGYGISELTDSTGILFSYRCKVGLVIQSPWFHVAHVKHAIIVGSPYVMAAIDPAAGIAAITGLGATFRTHLQIDLLDIEDANPPTFAPAWAAPASYCHDPQSRLGGEVKFFRVTGGVGNDTGFTLSAPFHARNLKVMDLVDPEYSPNVVYGRLFGQTGAAVTTKRPQTNQGSGWELPAASGTETYTSLTFVAGGGVSGAVGQPHVNVIEAGVSDCIISTVGRFNDISAGSLGLIARYASKDSFWELEWAAASGVATLYKKTAADTYTAMGNATIAPTLGQYYTLVIVLSGNSVKAYVNGTQVASVTDVHNSTSTKHGLFAFSSTGYLTGFRLSLS